MAITPQGMADTMENELGSLWSDHFGYELPDAGRDQRQILFLAVARGALRYLVEKSDGADDHVISTVDVTTEYGSIPLSIDDLEWNVDL